MEHFFQLSAQEIFIRFDLKSINIIQGFYIQSWYYTTIDEVLVGVHFDDEYTGQTLQFPKITSDRWKWFNGKPMQYCNEVQTIIIPKVRPDTSLFK